MKKNYSFPERRGTCKDAGSHARLLLFMLLVMSAAARAQTTYNYTGAVQTYTAAATGTVAIDMAGAKGGNTYFDAMYSYSSFHNGASGGRVVCSLAVTAGQVLYIYVGGTGQTQTATANAAGGYNGGGIGMFNTLAIVGGGGGGATDIRIGGTALGNRVVVAGGGGGAGFGGGSANAERGGKGGGTTGEGGYNANSIVSGGGTPTGGGVGSSSAPNGTLGSGGAGHNSSYSGGGGGGYYGGGGGYNSGAGGGSSFTNSSLATSVTHTQGYNAGNGYVIITGPPCTAGSTGGNITICSGNTVTLSGTGATTYSWTGGITNNVPFTPPAGITTYTVTGTIGTCTSTATTTITVNATPTVGKTGSGTAICAGATATLSGTGATTYSWTGGISNGVAFTPSAGVNVYTVTGTTGSCSATAIATVTVNALPTTGSTGGMAICNGNTATLSGTGAATYSWTGGISNGVAFLPALGVNTYTVTGTDANGCSSMATAMVTVNALPAVGSTGGGIAICSGNTATLSGTGATTFSWTGGISNGSAFSPATGINIYTVTGTDANGCSNAATATVTVNALPATGSTGGGVAICSGDMATLSGTGATTYSWTGGISDGVAFTPATGVNSYTVTGTNGSCTAMATTIITVNATPIVGSTGGDAAICSGTMATLSGTGATTYSWTGGIGNGESFAPAIGVNNYTVTGTNGSCTATATTTITVNATPATGSTGGGIVICSGNAATLSGTGATTYSWMDGISDGVAFTPATGVNVYTVTGTTGSCTATATTTITVNATPAVGITGGGPLCSGTMATLSGTGATTYSWTGGISNGVPFTPAAGTTTYTVTGTMGSCTATATTTVILNAVPVAIGGIAGSVYAFAGNGTAASAGDGGAATAASINVPRSVAADASGNVYISEYNGQYIRKVNTAGIITTVAGNATGSLGDGGPATVAHILGPWGIATDGLGNIYFAENGRCRVRKVTAAGIISTVAGTGYAGYNGDGAIATASSLNSPAGVAVDAAGNVYIADEINRRIRKVSTSGIITTVAGNGTLTYTAGSAATATGMPTLYSIAVDPLGNLYIGGSNRIYKVNTSGIISTYAGGGTAIVEGVAATASVMGNIYSLAVDVSGNLYFGDFIYSRVRKVDASGIITTVAGTGGAGTTGNGGPATAAAAQAAMGVALDGNGNLYFSQYNTQYVRKVVLGSGAAICTGSSVPMSNAIAGGTWSSNDTDIVSIGTSTGVATGLGAGTAVITYTLSGGCYVTSILTVNALPTVATTGSGTVCAGTTTALSGTGATAYIWTGNISNGVAFTPATGVNTYTVTGITGRCSSTATATITVNALPTVGSTGGGTICNGATATLSGTGAATYSWTGGIVNGSAFSPASGINIYTVTGTDANGCSNAAVATVTGVTVTITGAGSVNVSSVTALTANLPGGLWTSSNSGIATVGSTGVVAGAAAGVVTLSYELSGSCALNLATKTVTVNPATSSLPPIAGTLSVCLNGYSTLTNASTSGLSWTSSDPSVATINITSGVVTPVSVGTTVITYSSTSGAFVTAVVTINTTPAITGTTTVCAGTATTLSATISGGTWTSSNLAKASINASTGMLTAVSAGTSVITYMAANSCKAIALVSVSASPAAITGVTTLCEGINAVLANTVTGGTWSSSAVGVATINTAGLVNAIATGNTEISYTLANGCARTVTVTVNNAIPATTGTPITCAGQTSALSNTATGGTWSSSTPAVATVGTTGIVTGIAAGTANITYAHGAGCRAIANVTVNAAMPAITGAAWVCVNSTNNLAHSVSGGAWSSSNAALGSVSTTGVVTGITAGTPFITYTQLNGCYRTLNIQVRALPAAIVGNTGLCMGATSVVTNPNTGTSWTSSTPSVATVGSASGLVTGVSTGTSLLTYLATTGCIATRIITVDAVPVVTAITGPATVPVAGSITLANATPSGIWSSSNTAKATINSMGMVSGIAGGSATISYTVSNGVCNVSVTKALSITTSRSGDQLAGVENKDLVRVYPNPTTGSFSIYTPAPGLLTIYTLEGKEVQRTIIVQGTNSLSLSDVLASGIYMCRYTGDDGNTTMIRLVYSH